MNIREISSFPNVTAASAVLLCEKVPYQDSISTSVVASEDRSPLGRAVVRQAVEFGVEIGEYCGVVTVPRRVFQWLPPERPTPEKCVEAYYFQRTRFESIAERKLRRRHLTEDGNVENSGLDLRRDGGEQSPSRSRARHRPNRTGAAARNPKTVRRIENVLV